MPPGRSINSPGAPRSSFGSASKHKVTAEGLIRATRGDYRGCRGLRGDSPAGIVECSLSGGRYGQLEGILVALGFRIHRVRPQKWQGELGVKSRKGESKPDHKRRMRKMALDLFPHLQADSGRR